MLVIRARLGQNARSLVVLALLAGLGFGIALGCLAGARRTASAYERFVIASRPGDIEVGFDDATSVAERNALARRVAELPQVEQAAGLSWVFHTLADGTRDELVTFVALDDSALHDLAVPQVVDGRLPDRSEAGQLALNEAAAEQLGLQVGDSLELVGVPAEQQDAFFAQEPIQDGRRASFRVTGVVRGPLDLQPGSSAAAYLTPAYWEETVGQLALFGPSIAVDLEPGERDAFVAAVRAFLPESSIDEPDERSGGTTVSDATEVQAVALGLFAGLIVVTTLVFLGLAYVREAAVGRQDALALQSLGMTRRHRELVASAPLAVSALGGIAIAIAVAVALSPAFPFGLAGRAEPDRGLDVDLAVVGAAACVLLFLLVTFSLVATRIAQRSEAAPRPRPERSVPVPLPLSADVGLRFLANPGRGDRTIPIRSVLVTAIIGVALVVGTLGFGRSLDRLRQEPARFGWNFDVITGTSDDGDTFDRIAAAITAEPLIGDWTTVSAGPLVIDRTVVDALGVEPVVGDALPVMSDGRLPATAGEIALGHETAGGLGVSLGDEIDARRQDGDRTRTFEVVGVAVLPGGTHDFPGGLGSGAVMTLEGMATLGDAPRNVFFLRAAPGTDPEVLQAALEEAGPGFYGPSPGDEIDNLKGAADTIPSLVAALAVLAIVALTHGFSVTVRRRRPELAVLAALGMRPGQLRSVVRWQAGAIAVVGLSAGVLLGLMVVKVTWGPVARNLGVADDIAFLPPLGLLGLAAGFVGLTLAIASWAARSVARPRPSVALRAE